MMKLIFSAGILMATVLPSVESSTVESLDQVGS